MSFDAHKNFAYSTIAVAPIPASSGTSLQVAAGDGTLFPTVSFNAVIWAAGAAPLASNAEVVRVTGKSTDTFTITRSQESSSARAIVVGDQIMAAITTKSFTDIETSVVDASNLTTGTLLNARLNVINTPTLVTLSDGATPALDASLGTVFFLSAGGDRTIAVPTNPVSGQKIVIRHLASGGARTLALNSGAGGFRFGSDIAALTQTASGKIDYIGCIYNLADTKWDVVAVIKGF